jgi:hypothetical protein
VKRLCAGLTPFTFRRCLKNRTAFEQSSKIGRALGAGSSIKIAGVPAVHVQPDTVARPFVTCHKRVIISMSGEGYINPGATELVNKSSECRYVVIMECRMQRLYGQWCYKRTEHRICSVRIFGTSGISLHKSTYSLEPAGSPIGPYGGIAPRAPNRDPLKRRIIYTMRIAPRPRDHARDPRAPVRSCWHVSARTNASRAQRKPFFICVSVDPRPIHSQGAHQQ